MKTSHVNADWQVARPFLAFWRGFVALSLLVAVTTPFVTAVPSRSLLLLIELGYCAALSFLTLGICLLPSPIRSRALAVLLACPVVCALVLLAVFLATRLRSLEALDVIFPIACWALGLAGCLLLALSFYGWCHRLTHGTTKVA